MGIGSDVPPSGPVLIDAEASSAVDAAAPAAALIGSSDPFIALQATGPVRSIAARSGAGALHDGAGVRSGLGWVPLLPCDAPQLAIAQGASHGGAVNLVAYSQSESNKGSGEEVPLLVSRVCSVHMTGKTAGPDAS